MNKIICINPGHGGSDPGAAAGGIQEKDITLSISQYQRKRFLELGWEVVMTREKDVDSPLVDAAKKVVDSGAAICLSNHVNAFENKDSKGFEVIYSLKSNNKLSNLIFNNVLLTGLVKGRSVYTRESEKEPGKDYFYIVRETSPVQTLIIEYGFITNDYDRELLTNKSNQITLSEAVIKAVCDYAGQPYTSPQVQPQDPDAWKKVEIDELAAASIINDPDYWKERINDNMPVWAVMTLINRIRKG